MQRRTISSNEINLSSFMLVIIGGALLLMGFLGLGFSLYFCGIFVFLTHLRRKQKTRKKNVPGRSILISSKEMEIHVNNTAKGDIRNFLSIASESLVFGVENKLRITFYTWHLTPKYLRATLGEDIVIVDPGRYEKLAQLVLNRYYYKSLIKKKLSKKKINPLIKVMIDWDKIKPETLSKLQSKVKAT
ncbi:hypothetical protein CXK86_19820 [Paenibacillus sp. BGI2013]|uniref:hypothetical protein n=1 Tax=Paenibacillus sp. BGI2013 TaxID=2058902 RepID=UPI000C6E708B|nr:hypothetical protein [Paenibacillus sp. BGI2013]PKQ89301.1 hypothetical protein CXK86_19820 [Paenibacillus sp. BGI2013]